jgi:hypothetical protein
VLDWHWYWEPAGRFLALFSAISLSMTLGILITVWLIRYERKAALAFFCWIATTAVLSPLLYWVVVTEAATDNLVELMAGGGTPIGAFLLSIFVALATFGGSLLAAQFGVANRGRRIIGFLGLVISMPVAYLAFTYGTASSLEKYGKVFSAMQFLLSRDRDHYAEGLELMVRYIALYCGLIGTIAFIQYPFFAWLNRATCWRRGA